MRWCISRPGLVRKVQILLYHAAAELFSFIGNVQSLRSNDRGFESQIGKVHNKIVVKATCPPQQKYGVEKR